MSNFHLQEIQTLQNSLREREEYVTELENRLRALCYIYYGDMKHYTNRIKWLEEEVRVLRLYGNKDCTAQADAVLEAKEAKP